MRGGAEVWLLELPLVAETISRGLGGRGEMQVWLGRRWGSGCFCSGYLRFRGDSTGAGPTDGRLLSQAAVTGLSANVWPRHHYDGDSCRIPGVLTSWGGGGTGGADAGRRGGHCGLARGLGTVLADARPALLAGPGLGRQHRGAGRGVGAEVCMAAFVVNLAILPWS